MVATIPLVDDDVSAHPVETLKALTDEDIVIVAAQLWGDDYPNAPTEAFPFAQLPFRLEDADVRSEWEGQPAPNVPEYILLGNIRGQHLEVRVFFGTQSPASSVLAKAQSELDRLIPPDERSVYPLIVYRMSGGYAGFVHEGVIFENGEGQVSDGQSGGLHPRPVGFQVSLDSLMALKRLFDQAPWPAQGTITFAPPEGVMVADGVEFRVSYNGGTVEGTQGYEPAWLTTILQELETLNGTEPNQEGTIPARSEEVEIVRGEEHWDPESGSPPPPDPKVLWRMVAFVRGEDVCFEMQDPVEDADPVEWCDVSVMRGDSHLVVFEAKGYPSRDHTFLFGVVSAQVATLKFWNQNGMQTDIELDSSPPWLPSSVRLFDIGAIPLSDRYRATALDADGDVVAEVERG
jgi:hypothetical protein